ncbi:hypothetical protein Q3W71_11210 [Micromonospora sp. C28SCA-DRY-2]|uniref:hypothetical protein n=1 Tax=Micromonospora sp. C28SCA-DRY-2 TaxID=3059522 RepID=UPI002674A7F0|nr:hypothetical protein [Micromonospora sp. C28SCA-DRY-2]MDO3702245.1 hypothetical protein [Micromonospora sp. C28SCA-DRY-2]
MRDLSYLVAAAVNDVPALLVLLVGLVLAGNARRRLPRPARLLLLSGLGVLLGVALLGLTWAMLLPRVIDGSRDFSQVQLMTMASGLLQALAYPIGLALLVAAALAGRRATEGAPAGPWHGWPPAGDPPAPEAPEAPGVADGDGGTGGRREPAQWGGHSRPDGPGPAARA